MNNHASEIFLELLRDIEDPDESVRRIAVEELGDTGNEACVVPMIELLKREHNVGVLEAIGDALPKIKGKKTVSLLLPLLDSKDARIRNLVCEILIGIGTESLECLVEQMSSPDKDIRKFIVDVMGEIGSKEVVKTLIDSVRDQDINVACSAIESLGKIGDKRAVPALIKAARDGGPDKSYYAITALGKINDDFTADFLAQFIAAEEPLMKYAAVTSLGEMGSKDSVPKLKELLCSDDEIMKKTVLKAIGKTGVQFIEEVFTGCSDPSIIKCVIDCMGEQDYELRKYALMAAGYLNEPDVVKSAAEVLKKGGETKPFAIQALVRLGKINNNNLIHNIVKLLEVNELKEAVCGLLGDVQNRGTVSALTRMASDTDAMVVKSAILSLGKIGGDDAVKTVISKAHDENNEIREAAAIALGWSGSGKSVGILAELLRDSSAAVAETAANALAMINGDAVRDIFIANAKDSDPAVRESSMRALGSMPPGETIRAILLDGIMDSSAPVRKSAAMAMGNISSKEFMDDDSLLECLSPLIDDEDEGVKKAAIRALGRIRNGHASELLVDRLNTAAQAGNNWVKYEIIKVLKKYKSEKAEAILINQLIEGDMMLQSAACDSLGSVGGAKAKAVLQKLLKSTDTGVIEEVQKALNKIERRQE